MAEKTTTKKTPTRKPASKPAAARKPRAPKAAEHKEVAHKKEEAAHVEHATEAKPVRHTKTAGHGATHYAVGKRKTSVAQILLSENGEGTITINKLQFENYFQTQDLQYIVLQPLISVGLEKSINVKAKIHGGGIHSQAEALRHAVSRALILLNPESRRQLKKQGFLTRDPRVKERKKPGLKRARRAPQFSKR